MSTHDRGAFGALLAEVKASGSKALYFLANLEEPDESETRWVVRCMIHVTSQGAVPKKYEKYEGAGRTGEEALRRLVEKLRIG